MERPWIATYKGDWRSDPGLSVCSLAACEVWHRLLMVMDDSPRIGCVLMPNGQPPAEGEELAGMLGRGWAECEAPFRELEAAYVIRRTPMSPPDEDDKKAKELSALLEGVPDKTIYSRFELRRHLVSSRNKRNGEKRNGRSASRSATRAATGPASLIYDSMIYDLSGSGSGEDVAEVLGAVVAEWNRGRSGRVRSAKAPCDGTRRRDELLLKILARYPSFRSPARWYWCARALASDEWHGSGWKRGCDLPWLLKVDSGAELERWMERGEQFQRRDESNTREELDVAAGSTPEVAPPRAPASVPTSGGRDFERAARAAAAIRQSLAASFSGSGAEPPNTTLAPPSAAASDPEKVNRS